MKWQTKEDFRYITNYYNIKISRAKGIGNVLIINNIALRYLNDITCHRLYEDNLVSISSYLDLYNKPLYYILFKSFQKRKKKR